MTLNRLWNGVFDGVFIISGVMIDQDIVSNKQMKREKGDQKLCRSA